MAFGLHNPYHAATLGMHSHNAICHAHLGLLRPVTVIFDGMDTVECAFWIAQLRESNLEMPETVEVECNIAQIFAEEFRITRVLTRERRMTRELEDEAQIEQTSDFETEL